jgi:hypothetical protein
VGCLRLTKFRSREPQPSGELPIIKRRALHAAKLDPAADDAANRTYPG